MARLMKIVLVILVTDSLLCAVNPRECDVRVKSAWPKTVFTPNNSTVYIDCTTTSESDKPFWSVKLAVDDATFLPFFIGRTTLNGHGVYEIETTLSTLRLVINRTDLNNGTVIQCVSGQGRILLQTSLYIYESAPLVYALTVEDATLKEPLSLNISWIDLAEPVRQYNLTVENTAIQQWTFTTDDPYYIFTAPEDAPPCEIYNFSLAASYIGVTYTGDDCGLPPSLEISTMLPSLPDISGLQSTHNYSLEKLTGEIVLKVYFQPATFCEDYPVTNYTLELTGVQVASSEMKFTSMDNVIVASNLSENAVYIYQLSVTNSVGTVSANITQQIYTTDVQYVRISSEQNRSEIAILCTFLPGSDARGCAVVLTGELNNLTIYVTKDSNAVVATIHYELPLPLFCYYQAYGFDIEANGLTGSLSVPAYLHGVMYYSMHNESVKGECTISTENGTERKGIIIEVILAVTAVVTIFVITVTIIILIVCKVLKIRTRLPDTADHDAYDLESKPDQNYSYQHYSVNVMENEAHGVLLMNNAQLSDRAIVAVLRLSYQNDQPHQENSVKFMVNEAYGVLCTNNAQVSNCADEDDYWQI